METPPFDPTPESDKQSSVLRLWRRIPVLVRATIAALVVQTGAVLLTGLFVLNQQFLPGLPWGAAMILVLFWFYWLYLGGRGRPRSTSRSRRASFAFEHRRKPAD
jgi:hypothetical protein